MSKVLTVLSGGLLSGALLAAPAFAAEPLTCAQLPGVTIPASAIGLPTTGGSVTSATLVPASGSGASAIPEYCRVDGRIGPIDPAAPNILFRVALPTAPR